MTRFLIITMSLWMAACAQQPEAHSKQKILFVVSNAHYYGGSDINTANHFPEIVFAYDEFMKSGYSVDFLSPQGGAVPLGYIYSDTLLKRYLYDADFMDKLQYTQKPDEINPKDYKAIFYAGGGAAMFGIPNNATIQKIARNIYAQPNGIVSAVCHGTAGITNIKNPDGSFLIAGKNVNGFPDLFENKEAAYFQEFPFSIEEEVQRNGGVFKYSKEGWDGYLEVDGRIITGQDPSSSASVAKAVIETLRKNS